MLKIKKNNIITSIEHHATVSPDRLAITDAASGRTITYTRLMHRVREYSAELLVATPRPKFCCLMQERSIELISAILGCLHADVPFVVLDLRQKGHRLGSVLSKIRSGVIVADPAGLNCLQEISQCQDLSGFALRSTRDAPTGMKANSVGVGKAAFGSLPDNPSAAFRDATTHRTTGNDIACVLFTSGSTGNPKGVQIGVDDLSKRASMEAEWFELTSDDLILGVLPFSFDVGLIQLLGTFSGGGHFVVSNDWLARDVCETIDRHSVTGLAITPFFWLHMLQGNHASDALWTRLQKLRYATISGGDLAESDVLLIAERIKPCGLYKTYGMTEMFRIASLHPTDVVRCPSSVGRSYPGVEFRVLADDGTQAKPFQIGEVSARGLGRSVGYLHDEITELEAFQKTGDFGYVDSDGYLFLTGRRDDMIKILDQRVFPAEIERNVCELLQIATCSVVTVKHGNQLKMVCFILECQWNGREDEARSLLRRKLPGHFVPTKIKSLPTFPFNDSGKVDRRRMIEIASVAESGFDS